jgi:hypothetical protein
MMTKATNNSERQLTAAYNECLPLTERTSGFLNGLMVAVRPAILELANREDIGEIRAGGETALFIATKSINLEDPRLRVWQVKIRDTYESGKRHSDATIRTSDVIVSSDYPNHPPPSIGGANSELTWGYAESGLLAQNTTYTLAGDGNKLHRHGTELSRYDRPEKLRSDYTEAYVTRAASGLLLAQMVHGFSTAQEGMPLDMEKIDSRALALFEAWSAIDEATVATTLVTLDQLHEN